MFIFNDAPCRFSYPEAKGLLHIAFSVNNLEKLLVTLAEEGVVTEPVRADPYTQAKFAFVEDPGGLPVELYQYM